MKTEEQKKAREGVFEFDSHPEDPVIILRYFLDFILYQPSSTSATATSEDSPLPTYAGLSPAAVNVITNKGKITWSHLKLTAAKVSYIISINIIANELIHINVFVPIFSLKKK